MQNGKFLCFVKMTSEQHQILGNNISPEFEDSLFKQVPVGLMETAKQVARNMFPGRRIRVRYRGPRHDSMRQTCLKHNARSVAIYVD